MNVQLRKNSDGFEYYSVISIADDDPVIDTVPLDDQLLSYLSDGDKDALLLEMALVLDDWKVKI